MRIRQSSPHRGIASPLRAIARDRRGIAALEMALAAPLVLGLFLAGAELTNFTIAKMRMSQIALHIADNGSRIGTKSLLTNPQISEMQINDLLTGAAMQAGSLGLFRNGRVIISSLEPVASPNTTNRFTIRWQRCKGSKLWPSTYGVQGDTNLTGMGPAGRQVTAPDDGGVIYVEIAYDYQPLISSRVVPTTLIREVAAMTVRDDRDYAGNGGTGVYNTEGVPISSCTATN